MSNPWWWYGGSLPLPSGIASKLSPDALQAQIIMRRFLLAILPDCEPVVMAQDVRVPEPKSDDFVTITYLHRKRLATNTSVDQDVEFSGTINGNVLTVNQITTGALLRDLTIFGDGVWPQTKIEAFLGSYGGAGQYRINKNQMSLLTPQAFSAGYRSITQASELVLQLDVHGPRSTDNAALITTLFRDDFAADFFAQLSTTITPFYADEAKQIPFLNDQNQIETRWVIEAHLETDITTRVPQQFFDEAQVTLAPVEVDFPA